MADRLCERGRFGQKSGAGWYLYDAGDRKPIPDPQVDEIVEEAARAAVISRRPVSAAEIVERSIDALIKEGARVLEEMIALRAADIDMIFIHGYGFPAHRGGPMWSADTVGSPGICERICAFRKQHSASWIPAPVLERLARNNGTIAEFDRSTSQ